MLTQDVILGITALTATLCCMSSIASLPLAACRLASNNVKAAEKVAEKVVDLAAEKAAGAEVIKAASVAVASAEEEDSKRGER